MAGSTTKRTPVKEAHEGCKAPAQQHPTLAREQQQERQGGEDQLPTLADSLEAVILFSQRAVAQVEAEELALQSSTGRRLGGSWKGKTPAAFPLLRWTQPRAPCSSDPQRPTPGASCPALPSSQAALETKEGLSPRVSVLSPPSPPRPSPSSPPPLLLPGPSQPTHHERLHQVAAALHRLLVAQRGARDGKAVQLAGEVEHAACGAAGQWAGPRWLDAFVFFGKGPHSCNEMRQGGNSQACSRLAPPRACDTIEPIPPKTPFPPSHPHPPTHVPTPPHPPLPPTQELLRLRQLHLPPRQQPPRHQVLPEHQRLGQLRGGHPAPMGGQP